jgi:hypothetical protein
MCEGASRLYLGIPGRRSGVITIKYTSSSYNTFKGRRSQEFLQVEFQTLERGQFGHKSFSYSRHTAITTDVFIGRFAASITAASSADQEDWKFLQFSDRFCLVDDVLYDTAPYPTTIDVSRQFGCFFRY